MWMDTSKNRDKRRVKSRGRKKLVQDSAEEIDWLFGGKQDPKKVGL